MTYNHPKYGKWLQKLNNMDESQKAIFDIGSVAAMKGSDDIKQAINALNQEASGMSRETTRQGLEKDYEMREEAFEDEKKLKPLAHALGAVNLLSGVVGGYNRYRLGKREGDFYDQLLSNGMTTE